MKKYFLIFILFIFTCPAFADETAIALDSVKINPYDKAAIKRGAKFFATTCIACHTLKFLRYDKIAKEAGINYDKMPFNLKLNGISPPDLSLITRVKSPDWVYTYLHSFYVDPSRPSGYNNLVFPNTAMPNPLVALQGQQFLVKERIGFTYHHQPRWFDLLVLQKQGSMTPEQFDAITTDLVNFLAYAAEPYQIKQMRLGVWVIGFLILFGIFAYLLKKEYWKDVDV